MIRLVRADPELLDAALAGDDCLARALGHDVVAGWVTFTEALQPTREALARGSGGADWGSRLFVTDHPPELVGWGGFKGAPRNGVVELGYEIAEARRGRGLATAAIRAMVAEAFADERVVAVIAHTLAERNASNRVLERVGFRTTQTRRRTVRRSGATCSPVRDPRGDLDRLPALTFDFRHFRAAPPPHGYWELVIDEHRYAQHAGS